MSPGVRYCRAHRCDLLGAFRNRVPGDLDDAFTADDDMPTGQRLCMLR